MFFMTPNESKMMIILFVSMMLSIVFISLGAQAYIPTTNFILDRVVTQHGKGTYQIEAEVTLREHGDSIKIKEFWIVNDAGEMRVRALGDSVRITKLLKNGRLYWVDENGAEKVDDVSNDHFMIPLFYRSATPLKTLLSRWSVLPNEAFRERRLPKDVREIKNEPESWVRLSRSGGTVTWAFGTPSPVDGDNLPGFWVEQDAFIIRKMRSPSGAEFLGDDYTTFSKNLWFPRSQTISFNGRTASIHVTKVLAQDLNAESRKLMEPSALKAKADAATVLPKSELAPVVAEFYKRFR